MVKKRMSCPQVTSQRRIDFKAELNEELRSVSQRKESV